MTESRTICIQIDRDWKEVYEAIWRPEDFPKWASGLSQSSLTQDGDAWRAVGPEGEVRIAFTEHNAYGVMDHHVDAGDGRTVHVPMRVVRNGDGAEVQLTLFRQPDMSDAKFDEDAAWVKRDLQSLKAFVMQQPEVAMRSVGKIAPCLWFDDRAEEAVAFYTAIFGNSRVVNMARYGEAGHEIHGRPAGTVMSISFELDGQAFTALNGGPVFTFNEAISLQVNCKTQEEVDYYWARLSEGGDEHAQQCGWLKDKYGVSWQVVPVILIEMASSPDYEKSQRVMEAMLQMKKLDIAKLKQAYAG